MMAGNTERPQFYENNLQPIHICKESLLETLADLRAAVRRGVDMIETFYPPPDIAEENAFGSICSGHLGIALTYLRLEYQSAYLRAEDDESSLPDFRTLAHQRVTPYPLVPDVQLGRPSPVASASLGSAMIRVISRSPITHSSSCNDVLKDLQKDDIEALHNVVQIALQQNHTITFRGHYMGGDDIMTGRTGLLWAIANIQQHRGFNESTMRDLNPIFEAVPNLVDVIMDAGQVGAEEYVSKYGDANALPLMWLWLDGHYGFGGMHGTTGILAILLTIITTSATDTPARTYLPIIARTIIALCKLCISHNGHLPMSVPDFVSKTIYTSPRVQICHGTPSLLYLLALAQNNDEFVKTYWTPECDEAIKLASQKIWKEGMLSKGGGLCHGIAGNAWPWLVLHDAFEYNLDETGGMTADDCLSKALAFLVQAKKTQPSNTDSDEYRMPDKPYGLYEGLAGTVCAWAEACVIIVARLRKMELDEQVGNGAWQNDESLQVHLLHELGFPTLGGSRVTGLL